MRVALGSDGHGSHAAQLQSFLTPKKKAPLLSTVGGNLRLLERSWRLTALKGGRLPCSQNLASALSLKIRLLRPDSGEETFAPRADCHRLLTNVWLARTAHHQEKTFGLPLLIGLESSQLSYST
jgi:hypothetical protein